MDQSVTQAIQGFLYEKEAQNALILGLLNMSQPANRLPFYDASNQLCFFALYTAQPYSNLLFSHSQPLASSQLIESLQKSGINPKGVIGPAETVQSFVKEWQKLTAQSARVVMEQMLYEMTELNPPQHVSGSSRIAEQKDFDLITEWNLAFRKESLPAEPLSREEAMQSAQTAIDNRDTFLWVDDKSKIVSSAQIARPTANTMCVRFVYTPPEERKKGYASAVTAAASEAIFKLGKKSCVLYTDAKNPTSNKIYQKLGYKWVCNSIYYQF